MKRRIDLLQGLNITSKNLTIAEVKDNNCGTRVTDTNIVNKDSNNIKEGSASAPHKERGALRVSSSINDVKVLLFPLNADSAHKSGLLMPLFTIELPMHSTLRHTKEIILALCRAYEDVQKLNEYNKKSGMVTSSAIAQAAGGGPTFTIGARVSNPSTTNNSTDNNGDRNSSEGTTNLGNKDSNSNPIEGNEEKTKNNTSETATSASPSPPTLSPYAVALSRLQPPPYDRAINEIASATSASQLRLCYVTRGEGVGKVLLGEGSTLQKLGVRTDAKRVVLQYLPAQQEDVCINPNEVMIQLCVATPSSHKIKAGLTNKNDAGSVSATTTATNNNTPVETSSTVTTTNSDTQTTVEKSRVDISSLNLSAETGESENKFAHIGPSLPMMYPWDPTIGTVAAKPLEYDNRTVNMLKTTYAPEATDEYKLVATPSTPTGTTSSTSTSDGVGVNAYLPSTSLVKLCGFERTTVGNGIRHNGGKGGPVELHCPSVDDFKMAPCAPIPEILKHKEQQQQQQPSSTSFTLSLPKLSPSHRDADIPARELLWRGVSKLVGINLDRLALMVWHKKDRCWLPYFPLDVQVNPRIGTEATSSITTGTTHTTGGNKDKDKSKQDGPHWLKDEDIICAVDVSLFPDALIDAPLAVDDLKTLQLIAKMQDEPYTTYTNPTNSSSSNNGTSGSGDKSQDIKVPETYLSALAICLPPPPGLSWGRMAELRSAERDSEGRNVQFYNGQNTSNKKKEMALKITFD